MAKDKEPVATDAAKEYDVRQIIDPEQPRQAPSPEPAAPDSS